MPAYHAAVRLSAWLGLSPDMAYLHAGVRQGAASLDLNVSGNYLTRDRLLDELDRLQPDEAAGFLCLFKDRLRGASGGRTSLWSIDV